LTRLTLLGLVLVASPALAEPPACRAPAITVPAMPAAPDGPARSLPITSYTLALTWAPDVCARNPASNLECRGKTARFGFVLHGLWPDSDNGTWPQWCPTRSPATAQVPAYVVRHMVCTTPSVDLIAHEWGKHGTCMAPNPQTYFTQSSRMFHALHMPDMATLARRSGLTAGALRAAFADANPRYPRKSIGVMLGQDGSLQELHLCHDRSFRPTACAMRGAADTAEITIAAP
jgi:ribonuclease T2